MKIKRYGATKKRPIKGLKTVSIHQIEKGEDIDYRTWLKYTETTFYLTSQYWKIGNNGDALCGIGPNYDCHCVVRIGEELKETRGNRACLETTLELFGLKGAAVK